MREPATWANRELTADEIASVTRLAEPLMTDWWEKISQQLQHCTHPRFQQKLMWPFVEMHKALGVVVEAFLALKAIDAIHNGSCDCGPARPLPLHRGSRSRTNSPAAWVSVPQPLMRRIDRALALTLDLPSPVDASES